MNLYIIVASETSVSSSPLDALGVSPKVFVIQLITFVFVFLLLKRFAFGPIGKILAERKNVIDAGVLMGQQMEKKNAELEEKVMVVLRDARTEADKIIANGHQEAREIIREAEKVAQRKGDIILQDAEDRIADETVQAKKRLEKQLIGLVSEATEAIVGEKIDAKKDTQIVERIIKGMAAK